MLKWPILLLTCAAPSLAFARCQSQSTLDALAAATANQVNVDMVAECGKNNTGVCYPITLRPGDVLPGDGTSITDAEGNTWSLTAPPQDGSGHWYGATVFNGRQVNEGYVAALRLINGRVYAEEAKGAGWQVADTRNPGNEGNKWQYVGGDPGQGSICSGGQPPQPSYIDPTKNKWGNNAGWTVARPQHRKPR